MASPEDNFPLDVFDAPNHSVEKRSAYARIQDAMTDLEATIARSKRDLLTWKSRHNMFANISRLPDEVLTEILILAVHTSTVPLNDPGSTQEFINHRIPYSLATQVCARWRRITLKCSKLWSKIQYSVCQPVSVLDETFRRSGIRHLTVGIEGYYNCLAARKAKDILARYLARVKHLEILDPEYEQDLLRGLGNEKAPVLETFCLVRTRSPYRMTQIPPSTFLNTAPLLRSFHIRNYTFSNSTPLPFVVFSNLQTLDIRYDRPPISQPMWMAQSPSFAQFFSALQQLPQLRHLRLHNAFRSLGHDDLALFTANDPFIRVPLPDLRSVRINDIEIFCMLATLIQSPQDTRWNVAEYLEGREAISQLEHAATTGLPKTLRRRFAENIPHISICLSETEAVPLRLELGSSEDLGHAKHPTLLSFVGESGEELVKKLPQILPLHPCLQHLSFLRYELPLSSEEIWKGLGRWDTLTTLAIVYNRRELPQVLSYHRTPLDDLGASSATSFCFPGLKQLVLIEWVFSPFYDGYSVRISEVAFGCRSRWNKGFGPSKIRFESCKGISSEICADLFGRSFSIS